MQKMHWTHFSWAIAGAAAASFVVKITPRLLNSRRLPLRSIASDDVVGVSVRNCGCICCLCSFPHVERAVTLAASPAQHIARCQYGFVLRKCCMSAIESHSNFLNYLNF